MKILNFVVRTHQKSEIEPNYQGNLLFSDLPGFLHDCYFPVRLSSKTEREITSFKIIIKNNICELIHNGQKNIIESQEIVELDHNTFINIILENIDELNSGLEIAEKSVAKNITYAISQSMPKISTDYALIDDHFSAPPLKNENISALVPFEKYNDKNSPHGNILRDLEFIESRNLEINSLIKC